LLHAQSEAYATRPSEFLGLETPWGAWQIDQLVFMEGRRLEKLIADGKNPFASQQKPSYGQFVDPRRYKRARRPKAGDVL